MILNPIQELPKVGRCPEIHPARIRMTDGLSLRQPLFGRVPRYP